MVCLSNKLKKVRGYSQLSIDVLCCRSSSKNDNLAGNTALIYSSVYFCLEIMKGKKKTTIFLRKPAQGQAFITFPQAHQPYLPLILQLISTTRRPYPSACWMVNSEHHPPVPAERPLSSQQVPLQEKHLYFYQCNHCPVASFLKLVAESFNSCKHPEVSRLNQESFLNSFLSLRFCGS